MQWCKLVKVVLLVTALALLVVPSIAGAGSCPLCNIFSGGSSSYSSSPGYGNYGYSGGYGYGYGQNPYWSQYRYSYTQKRPKSSKAKSAPAKK